LIKTNNYLNYLKLPIINWPSLGVRRS
jgi:hypothetical protein